MASQVPCCPSGEDVSASMLRQMATAEGKVVQLQCWVVASDPASSWKWLQYCVAMGDSFVLKVWNVMPMFILFKFVQTSFASRLTSLKLSTGS